MSKLPGWKELAIGGSVLNAGNTMEKSVAGWRTYRPIWHSEKCIHCLRCWVLCPDSAIQVKDAKVTGIDYEHCKGCGICSQECPVKGKAITMKLESEVEKK